MCEDASAGTPSVPLALADWSNAQIVKYCNACGISFDCSVGHVDACIDYIRNVEKNSFLDWCYLQCGEGGDLLGGPRQLDCFFMNIISWNVRGLGRPTKRFLVKDFLNLHFVDVCCLQESKLEDISGTLWREIGGPRLDKFVFLPAIGSSGGIIVGWNSVLLSGTV